MSDKLVSVLQIYNNTVHWTTGISPAQNILCRTNNISSDVMNVCEQSMSKPGHQGIKSHKVGDWVLKEVESLGRKGENKLKPYFEGLTYQFLQDDTKEKVVASQFLCQLRPWQKIPRYV